MKYKFINYSMHRFKKKRKILLKIKKRNFILIIIIFLLFGIVLVFKFINSKVTPVFLALAKSETEKMATLIINDAVGKKVSDGLKTDNLFVINKDNKGKITSIDFNSVTVNKLLTTITTSVELNLKYLEEGRIDLLNLPDSILVSYDEKDLKKGIIYKIPSGAIFNNTVLSNIGPKIPVKLNLVGSITSNISTKTTNYGINNALIEVYVDLSVTLEVILPYTKKNTTVKTSIPVALKMIQGSVPSYYSNSNNSPSISVPIE